MGPNVFLDSHSETKEGESSLYRGGISEPCAYRRETPADGRLSRPSFADGFLVEEKDLDMLHSSHSSHDSKVTPRWMLLDSHDRYQDTTTQYSKHG